GSDEGRAGVALGAALAPLDAGGGAAGAGEERAKRPTRTPIDTSETPTSASSAPVYMPRRSASGMRAVDDMDEPVGGKLGGGARTALDGGGWGMVRDDSRSTFRAGTGAGPGTPSAGASVAIMSVAVGKRCAGSGAVARSNHGSNAVGSGTPRRAAR